MVRQCVKWSVQSLAHRSGCVRCVLVWEEEGLDVLASVYLSKSKKSFWNGQGFRAQQIFSTSSLEESGSLYPLVSRAPHPWKHSQNTSKSSGKIIINLEFQTAKYAFKNEGKMKRKKQTKTRRAYYPQCFIKEIDVVQQEEK